MPRYDYRCPSCKNGFEVRQSFQDPPVAACPKCGTESQRVIHAPEIVYKARGFSAYDQRTGGFGSYWYNREKEADAKGASPDIGTPDPSSN